MTNQNTELVYFKTLFYIEQMNNETKVKLMQKLSDDLDLDKPYYCNGCEKVAMQWVETLIFNTVQNVIKRFAKIVQFKTTIPQ